MTSDQSPRMEKKDGTRSEKLTKKGVSSIKGNIIVFAFFLLLSFIFWYLNSLDKELETDIRYPVRYTNIPKNRTLTEDIPSRLNLFLRGPGYSIMKLKISGNRAPVLIDFSKVPYKHLQNSKPADYYIVTSGLIQDFNSQLKSECRISSVKPDTLFFTLESNTE